MTGRYPTEVVRVVAVLLAPFIAMYGLYIVAHGHYGPGGGFAGGVFLAVAAILPRLTLDAKVAYAIVPEWLGPFTAGVGLLVFLVVGTLPLLVGEAFLDYAAIEVAGTAASRLRYLGILVVEAGVGLTVFGAMLIVFDVLTRGRDA
jgi:multicomponent Na+:H+ antiporter subunit B